MIINILLKYERLSSISVLLISALGELHFRVPCTEVCSAGGTDQTLEARKEGEEKVLPGCLCFGQCL